MTGGVVFLFPTHKQRFEEGQQRHTYHRMAAQRTLGLDDRKLIYEDLFETSLICLAICLFCFYFLCV